MLFPYIWYQLIYITRHGFAARMPRETVVTLRPLAAMVSAINAQIIETRHGFKTISTDQPIPKAQRLGPNFFKAEASEQSLPFEDICNFEAKTKYYSPKSENNNVQLGG